MRNRNHHISVWLNDAEYGHLKRQVEITGLRIDPYVRQLITGKEIKPKPPQEYAEILRKLSAIGNNMNQIAYHANARRGISDEDIQAVARLARLAWELVKTRL